MMKTKYNLYVVMAILIFALSNKTIVKAATEETIYYVEHPVDEMIAIQKALSNHEEVIKVRYRKEYFNQYEPFIVDPMYYAAYHYYIDDVYADCSFGLFNLIGTGGSLTHSINQEGYYYGYSYPQREVTARGMKWTEFTFNFTYVDTYKDYEKTLKEIRKIIKDSNISTKSDYDKAVWLYNWIYDNIIYARVIPEAIPIHTAISKKYADNNATAGLYSMFADELGLNNRIVFGEVNEFGRTATMRWNIVELDGKWYHVDSRSIVNNKGEYLLKGLDTISAKYTLNNAIFLSKLNFSKTDCKGSKVNSGVNGEVYGIKFDSAKIEKLTVGELYRWLISNPDKVALTFTSSDSKVVSIDKSGKTVALEEGIATITATNKELGIKQTCEIYVIKELATALTVIADDVKVQYGKKTQIKLNVYPEDTLLENVEYTSSNKSIATVTKTGKVKGIKVGTTYVTISHSDGEKVKVKITVSPQINKKSASVNAGKKVDLSNAIVISSKGTKDLKYTSSDNKIATVTTEGMVTGKKKGTITIKVFNKSTDKLLGSIKVTVK